MEQHVEKAEAAGTDVARLAAYEALLDAFAAVLRARIAVSNSDARLRPGMFVRLRVPGTKSYGGALVRDGAVGTDLNKRFVYVVGNDKTIAQRAVTLGPNLNGLRVVRSGLSKGDRIVVNGLQRVRPGMKVEPVTVQMEAPAQGEANGQGAAGTGPSTNSGQGK